MALTNINDSCIISLESGVLAMFYVSNLVFVLAAIAAMLYLCSFTNKEKETMKHTSDVGYPVCYPDAGLAMPPPTW